MPAEETQNVSRPLWRKAAWPWVPTVGAICLFFGAIYLFLVEAPPPKTLIIATGASDGAYYKFATQYAERLKNDGISVTVLETKGSIENLQLLLDENSNVDAALLQGGVAGKEHAENLQSLGSLYREPFWVFYRGEIDIRRLPELKQKTIAIGPPGSGTRSVAMMLLKANNLADGQLKLSDLNGMAAAQALEEGLIDGACFVAGVNTSYVQRLLKAPGIRVLDFVQQEAYSRRYRYLTRVTIPAGLVDAETNIPDRDIRLVAPAATLVTRKSIHPALVTVLVSAASRIHGPGDELSSPNEFPSTLYTDIPMSDHAEHVLKNGPPFLQRVLPFWLATFIDRVKLMIIPLVMVLMPLFRAAPPLLRWRTRRRIYLWYSHVRELDQRVISGMEKLEAIKALDELKDIEKQAASVEIPLSYMEEYYNMRVHLDLVLQRLRRIVGET
jgi:uncharacterized protein